MADGITIPSPSVFLRKTPSPPAPSEHSQPDSRPRHARKTSRTSKAPSKKADDAVAAPTQKPKQSKSRNGCSTCKAKRLKCDEQKPGCLQCAKRKVQCGGYKKDFKWRPFEETNVKINIDRHQKVTPPQAQSSGASQTTTPVSEHPPGLTNDPPSQIKQNHGLAARAEGSITSPQRASPSNNTDNHSHSHSAADHTQDQEPTGGLSEALLSTSTLATSDDTLHTTPQVDPPQLSAELPATFESLSPISPLGLPNPPTDDFDVDPFGLIMPQPDVQAIVNDEDIEQILQDEMTVSNDVWLPQSRNDSFNGIAGTATDFLWQGPVDYLYSQPSFAEDSPEMLCFRFDKLTCGILSVMDGAVENPWRSLVFPMAQSSPALYHAVMSMTAFHSSKDVPGLRLTGQEHKQASLTYIQEGIRDSSMTDQTAIATALALGFCESWDRHTKSGNTHIKGAQVLVKRALANHQRNPLQGIELARMKFLCNAWVYMDVIARLTSVDSDESNDFDNPFLFNLVSASPLTGQDEQPGFGIDFGMPIDARLDPLMGCAGTLFPLIGRVANLVRKVCRSQSNSAPVISQANDLKLALETWEPPAFIEPPEDPTSQVLHALQTAEAYRWATLLHLHQSVPELPSMDSSELAQKVLTYLATVPLASRTVIVQIYPLMVAGCEASTSEDRQWVRDRWTAMLTRMRIGVVDKCAVVTEEVWRRKDTYEAQPTTKRKLVATAALQQSRKRSERPHDGCQDSSPGHTGMVFSWAEDEGEVTREEKSFWPPNVRDKAKSAIGSMDSAYTVRGHCHWVGVMWDWGWEVLLG